MHWTAIEGLAFYLAPFCYGTMSITYTMDLLRLELWQEGGMRTISEVIWFQEKKETTIKVPIKCLPPQWWWDCSPSFVSLCVQPRRCVESAWRKEMKKPKCIEKTRYFSMCERIFLWYEFAKIKILPTFGKTKFSNQQGNHIKGSFRMISHIGTKTRPRLHNMHHRISPQVMVVNRKEYDGIRVGNGKQNNKTGMQIVRYQKVNCLKACSQYERRSTVKFSTKLAVSTKYIDTRL